MLYLYFVYTRGFERGTQMYRVYRRIRDLREDADLNQTALAEYLHCSQVCYSQYELGKRDIPTESLIALAKFHHTSIDYLLELTDIKTPYPVSKK